MQSRRFCVGRSHVNVFRGLAFLFAAVVVVQPSIASASAQSAQAAASLPAPNQSAYALIPAASRVDAPDFMLTDVRGKKLSLSQYRGRVVLLDFWAVDCGGCRIEIPWYVEFDGKYRDQGLVVIGIDMYKETPGYILPFMAKQHMEYPVAVGNDQIGQKFRAEALPKTFLIDRDGRIAVFHVGIVDKAKFEQDIQHLLR